MPYLTDDIKDFTSAGLGRIDAANTDQIYIDQLAEMGLDVQGIPPLVLQKMIAQLRENEDNASGSGRLAMPFGN